ncbi:hypothetical protein [Candidatus Vallotia cooleyia]|uniref:hypothetical protein n=1 Tax=Candidatus Vallotiella adelgis TaxID=1177211 RepID=UPI001D021332|nr:hypothetical protein [Candidatus Vallotia cooleyia]
MLKEGEFPREEAERRLRDNEINYIRVSRERLYKNWVGQYGATIQGHKSKILFHSPEWWRGVGRD